MIEGDAGPIAVLKTEQGPADPATGGTSTALGRASRRRSTTTASRGPTARSSTRARSAATSTWRRTRCRPRLETDVDYGLYTFTLDQHGAGTLADPATFTHRQPDVPLQRPDHERVRRAAAGAAPEAAGHPVDRRPQPGLRHVPRRRTCSTAARTTARKSRFSGVDAIDSIAVIAARPTLPGETNDFSANDFEKRALIGFAPVYPDGSFRIKVPANTPISFATLDTHGPRRSWSSARTSTCARARSSRTASAATRIASRAGRFRPTRIRWRRCIRRTT